MEEGQRSAAITWRQALLDHHTFMHNQHHGYSSTSLHLSSSHFNLLPCKFQVMPVRVRPKSSLSFLHQSRTQHRFPFSTSIPRSATDATHYETLGVPVTASTAEIKKYNPRSSPPAKYHIQLS